MKKRIKCFLTAVLMLIACENAYANSVSGTANGYTYTLTCLCSDTATLGTLTLSPANPSHPIMIHGTQVSQATGLLYNYHGTGPGPLTYIAPSNYIIVSGMAATSIGDIRITVVGK